MSQQLIPSPKEDKVQCISIFGHTYRRSRFFAAFLICCALLVAAFAVSGISGGKLGDMLLQFGSFWKSDETAGDTTPPVNDPNLKEPGNGTPPIPETGTVPNGATPIRRADLSCMQLGSAYLHNQTAYNPTVSDLLGVDVSSPVTGDPVVLILHTHPSEGYLPSGSTYVTGAVGDATYTSDSSQNMLALGKALCDLLNEKSIPAIHCTVMHDDAGFGNAYARAMESIQFYLTHYPSIRYVIDLHRDSVLNSDGEYIKSLADTNLGETAQIMAVVGSDGGGEENSRWQGNLALALQLRETLNASNPGVARPVTLRNETFNQEAAPYSLLLEIGTGANSMEEAKRAIRLVADALETVIRGQ